MQISVQIATRNRFQPLCRAIESVLRQDYKNFEVVVLDDATENTELPSELRKVFNDPRIRCFRNEKWSGVSAVRSKMMTLSTGSIYCSIDDDGAFAHDSCLTRIAETFRSNPDVGLVTGKIKDYAKGNERLLLPFSWRALRRRPELANARRCVSYFRAGCYAVRREVIDACGPYRPEMRYGEEELDLSYRIVRSGYQIVYDPDLIAYHWPEPSALPNDLSRSEIYYQVGNRFHLAYAYLPVPYIPSYMAVWLSRYFVTSIRRRQVGDYFAGVKDGLRSMRRSERSQISGSALMYLRSNFGRLWY